MKLLTTLALIKTNIEQKNESILDSYTPFIRYYLVKSGCKNIDIMMLRAGLLDEFGLPIPIHSLKLMLEKMARHKELSLGKDSKYSVGTIIFDVNEFDNYRRSVKNGIDEVVKTFIKYAREVNNIELEAGDGEAALLKFMENQTINCVKAFVHNKEIEISDDVYQHQQFSVASFVEHLRKNDDVKFKLLIVLTIGQLGANLLNGASVIDPKIKLDGTTIFFDTPWLVKLLGYVGSEQKEVAKELLAMCKELGAKTATFTHLRNELDNVLYNVEKMLSGTLSIPHKNGHKDTDIYSFCRVNKITKTDVMLWRSQLDEFLKENSILVLDSPQIMPSFNISDEGISTAMTEVGLNYREDSKRTDIESIRSIYQLRKGVSPSRLEQSIATLCTTNEKLSKAAFKYGKTEESNFEVSSVVTDFSLCNLLWFKFPSKLINLPEKILIANCAAAIMPTVEFIQKYENELQKISDSGKISETAYQSFRYNASARDHLLNLTKGDPDELTEEQIQAVINSYDEKLTKPLREKYEQLSKEAQAAKDLAQWEQSQKNEFATKAQTAVGTVDNIITNLSKIIAAAINFMSFFVAIGVAAFTLTGKINPELGYSAAVLALLYTVANEIAKRFKFDRINFSKKLADWAVSKLK